MQGVCTEWPVYGKLVCIFLAYISLISLADAAILQKETLCVYKWLETFPCALIPLLSSLVSLGTAGLKCGCTSL